MLQISSIFPDQTGILGLTRRYPNDHHRWIEAYTAPNAAAARVALEELTQKWGRQQHGAIIRLWENAWEEFTPFLSYDVEIRVTSR